MTKTLHLLIHGRVQGVGYRAWTVARARALGLNGWVRNRRDGTVEAVIQGDETTLNQMLADCREGPPAARVSEIEVSDWADEVEVGFQSNPTA